MEDQTMKISNRIKKRKVLINEKTKQFQDEIFYLYCMIR